MEQNIRSRKWFLTINKEAECYQDFVNILVSCNYKYYAYILHDKDNEEQPHYHCVLEFENPHYFTGIQKTFVGAHIEDVNHWNMVNRYLIHNDDKDKHQYELSEVISSDIEMYQSLLNSDEFEKLTTDTIINDIENYICISLMDFVRKYGIFQVNKFTNLIKSLLQENDVKRQYKMSLESDYLKRIDELETIIANMKGGYND